jgi:hypothetical protein
MNPKTLKSRFLAAEQRIKAQEKSGISSVSYSWTEATLSEGWKAPVLPTRCSQVLWVAITCQAGAFADNEFVLGWADLAPGVWQWNEVAQEGSDAPYRLPAGRLHTYWGPRDLGGDGYYGGPILNSLTLRKDQALAIKVTKANAAPVSQCTIEVRVRSVKG